MILQILVYAMLRAVFPNEKLTYIWNKREHLNNVVQHFTYLQRNLNVWKNQCKYFYIFTIFFSAALIPVPSSSTIAQYWIS